MSRTQATLTAQQDTTLTHDDALPSVPAADRGLPDEFPTMYWGVGSHNSIRAFQHLHDETAFTDAEHDVNPGVFPDAHTLEISYTSENRDKIFPGPDWFIDCGGFTELRDTADGTYSFDADDYVAWIADQLDAGINIKYWALRDWPLSDALLHEHDRSPNDHLERTIRDHVACLELADEYGLEQSGASPVAVIQGTDKTEYLWSLDYYREHGLLTDRVMIGSLKALSPSEVETIVTAVRDELGPDHTIHALGLTQRHFTETTVLESIDATDTQSWNHARDRVSGLPSTLRNRRTGYLYAYAQYRADLINTISETRQVAQDRSAALFEYGEGRDAAVGHSNDPLIECLCGTLIDVNDIHDAYRRQSDPVGVPDGVLERANCRHCRRRLMRLLERTIDGCPDQFY